MVTIKEQVSYSWAGRRLVCCRRHAVTFPENSFVCLSECCSSACLSECQAASVFMWVGGCLSIWMPVCISACLNVCLTIWMPAWVSVWMPRSQYVYLSVYLNACLSVYLSECLSVYPSQCMSVCLFTCLNVRWSAHMSECLSVLMSFCPQACFNVCLFVCLFVYTSVSTCLSVLPYIPGPKHLSLSYLVFDWPRESEIVCDRQIKIGVQEQTVGKEFIFRLRVKLTRKWPTTSDGTPPGNYFAVFHGLLQTRCNGTPLIRTP